MSFQKFTIEQYQEELGSRKSTPSGGSALGLTLETAASLCLMVCNLTLNKKGYDVPKDFSVMARCYTNISRYTDYALTTADFNLDDVCGLAWDLMQKKLDNRYYSLNQRIVINCRLVIGETTAPPAE